eukprot:TRINITY_DN8134_c0_g1_i1.p1 TRINITY_DN8134_c0_g1~~TRINITY_DN8134_c0_g1_i1.p1  ORF type:complete len:846 (+),score=186.24 TRINITY_DN8134_c0_g1_i1:53-2590(+)
MAQYPQDTHEADVNTLFQNQTIDQLWVTLGDKKKEGEVMQKKLRQLVGDRYQDLLSASDMIVGMGDICDYLIESFEETKNARQQPSSSPTTLDETITFNSTTSAFDIRQSAVYMTDALHQIQAWLREGRYLEAALARRNLQKAVSYLEKWCAKCSIADSYLEMQIVKTKKHMSDLPEAIISHAFSAMVGLELSALQDASKLVDTCSQIVCCVALIDDLPLQGALRCFIDRQKTRLTSLLGSHTSPGTAITSLCTLYSVRSFLYKVFVERSVQLTESLELTTISTLYSSMSSNKVIMDLSKYISTTDYFPSNGLDYIPQELPPVADAKEMLANWQTKTAPVALSVLRSSLEQVQDVSEVVEIKAQLDRVTGLWDHEPVQAQPPSAWSDNITDVFRDCLTTLLHNELSSFVSNTTAELKSYVESDLEEELLDTTQVNDQELALRYTCGKSTDRDDGLDGEDRELPAGVREVVCRCHEMFERTMHVASTVMSSIGRSGEQSVIKALSLALQNVASVITDVAQQRPQPTTGAVVQGVSRVVALVLSRSKETESWLIPSLMTPFYTGLHEAYLHTFEKWSESVAGSFVSDVTRGLLESYWGPDKQVFEKMTYCSWEHRETQTGGDTIISNLPGYTTPAVLTALEASCREISKVAPALLRQDVVVGLHRRMGRVFGEYEKVVKTGEVCQGGLWQMLFDVRFIAEVCEGCKGVEYESVLRVLMDKDVGIDPVYWSTEQRLFEQIFAAAIDGSRLFFATHGLRPLQENRPPKDTYFDSFVAECDRFPTLHLAPLQTAPTAETLAHYAPTPATSTHSDAPASTPLGTLQGLQHLHALGTGLQQQWKGMKYFSWN